MYNIEFLNTILRHMGPDQRTVVLKIKKIITYWLIFSAKSEDKFSELPSRQNKNFAAKSM